MTRLWMTLLGGLLGAATCGATGPDVIVTSITGIANYDSEDPSGAGDFIDAFSVGTIACNAGDETLVLSGDDHRHAVIRQGMFRLCNGRFEQIGTSWVRHVYPASNDPGACGMVCQDPQVPGFELRSGCSDPNTASLNGDRVHTGPASDVNAFTGAFPYPIPLYPATGTIAQRLQVRHADLDPLLNPGASYFVQAHYVHPGDAAAANGDDNASFAPVTITRSPTANTYTGTGVPPEFVRGQRRPAVYAWQDADPAVVVSEARVPGEGLFILAAKATDRGAGIWHYEYALQNLDSDRCGGAFRIPLPLGALVREAGFHGVRSHSGEIWDNTDWFFNVEPDSISWSTVPYAANADANAVRWSTLYNFRFDANAGPAETRATLGLFKPGTPSEISIATLGPSTDFMDCNANGILDACDVGCDPVLCAPPCAASGDCNDNLIPDECEPDCNANGTPDSCDVSGGVSVDCDDNGVPDECDPDCDGDGIPDACEPVADTDADGVNDCDDLCPLTTPPGACLCPELDRCCFPVGFCIDNYPRSLCIAQGGTPDCLEAPCRDGCLIGDFDKDGDRDLFDAGGLQSCFSGDGQSPGFLTPSAECLLRFDFDDDGDVDPADLVEFASVMNGPD